MENPMEEYDRKQTELQKAKEVELTKNDIILIAKLLSAYTKQGQGIILNRALKISKLLSEDI